MHRLVAILTVAHVSLLNPALDEHLHAMLARLLKILPSAVPSLLLLIVEGRHLDSLASFRFQIDQSVELAEVPGGDIRSEGEIIVANRDLLMKGEKLR